MPVMRWPTHGWPIYSRTSSISNRVSRSIESFGSSCSTHQKETGISVEHGCPRQWGSSRSSVLPQWVRERSAVLWPTASAHGCSGYASSPTSSAPTLVSTSGCSNRRPAGLVSRGDRRPTAPGGVPAWAVPGAAHGGVGKLPRQPHPAPATQRHRGQLRTPLAVELTAGDGLLAIRACTRLVPYLRARSASLDHGWSTRRSPATWTAATGCCPRARRLPNRQTDARRVRAVRHRSRFRSVR
jgi:hypothetical protein